MLYIREKISLKMCCFTIFIIFNFTSSLTAQLSHNKNFISTISPKQPGAISLEAFNGLPQQAKVSSVEYLDGLGRRIQTIIPNGKANGIDLIMPLNYDDFGRVEKSYLPYTSSNASGLFRSDWEVKQALFYSDVTYSNNELPDNTPFNLNVYDNSSLNRIVKAFAAGDDWAGSSGSGTERSVNTDFMLFDPHYDELKTWEIAYSAGVAIPKISGDYTYQVGDLFKTIVTDEHGHKTEEFKDKSGNVILKKVQIEDVVSGQHNGWLCTYYVYDNLNRLRYVLPPKVIDLCVSSGIWEISQPIIDELCFWYEYDNRGRLITKHVPGALPVNMVYDKRDRLIFTQDGNMSESNTWLLTLYDFINRPNVTALYKRNISRKDLQQEIDNDALAGNQSIAILDNMLVISNKPSFTNIAELDILSITLYDNYDNSIGNANPYQSNQPTAYPSNSIIGNGDYAEAPVLNKLVPGKVTASKVKVLDPDITHPLQYLVSLTYYDMEYRPIQTQKQNLVTNEPGQLDIVTTQYDFTNKVLGSYETHYGASGQRANIITKNVYDAQGKISDIFKGINSLVADKQIVHNEYDLLGRLKTKTVAQGITTPAVEEYTYNIRSWIRGVNMNHLNTEITPASGYYFGYELGYNTLINGDAMPNPQFNGNIGAMIWASAGKAGRDMQGIWLPEPNENGIKREYEYIYDNTNRLKEANFKEHKNSFWNKEEKDFTMSVRYDPNGNIQNMFQMGVSGTVVQPIDELTYTYYKDGKSNTLMAVDDHVNEMGSTLGDFKEYCGRECPGKSGKDYIYDANGNLTTDFNKLIVDDNQTSPGIKYNYLNLPQEIKIYDQGLYNNKGVINFIYDALGNKLRKIVTDNSITPKKITTTDYVNGFMYENEELKQIAHEEGRIRWAMQASNQKEFKYDWFIKDHLGNTRMVLTEETDPIDAKVYKATFETEPTTKVTKDDIAKEKELFGEDVLSPTRNALPVELKDKDPGNKKCALLRPGTSKTPYKILKVSAGDKFTIGVQYYYRPQGKRTTGKNVREDILNNLIGGILGMTNGNQILGKNPGGNQWGLVQSPAANPNAIRDFTNDDNDNKHNSNRPRAYLNYILMDTAMQLIKGGALRVGNMDAENPEWKTLTQQDIQATKTGYFLVYISNEEQITSDMNAGNVYFDNFVIITNEGPIMEENHYYPFGLLMDAISTSGSGRLANKFKYNGKELNHQEFSDKSGLDWYDYGARMYDQQIGRWIHQDPLSDKMRRWSPFTYVFDNPIRFLDPDGMSGESIHLDEKGNVLRNYNDGDNSVYIHSAGISASSVDRAYINTMKYSNFQNTSAGGAKIGKLGESVDINSFFGKTLGVDAIKASKMDMLTWANHVRGGQDWDLKANTSTIFGVAWKFDKDAIDIDKNAQKTSFSFDKYSFKDAADVGNFHAGYTGTYTGVDYIDQWRGAGAVEMLKNTDWEQMTEGLTYFSPPYGDKPIDYKWNTIGMSVAAKEMNIPGPDMYIANTIPFP